MGLLPVLSGVFVASSGSCRSVGASPDTAFDHSE